MCLAIIRDRIYSPITEDFPLIELARHYKIPCRAITKVRYAMINPYSHITAYMRQWTGSALVQIMAYCSVPSQNLNQCLVVVSWNLRHKLQWDFQNTKHFIHQNAYENVVCEVAVILPRGDELIIVIVHNDILHVLVIKAMEPSNAIWCTRNCPSLVPGDNKALTAPMLTYHQSCIH